MSHELDLGNPRVISPEDYPVELNTIQPLAVHVRILDDGEEREPILRGLDKFEDVLALYKDDELGAIIREYFEESQHQSWDGHEDLAGNNLKVVYDQLFLDIALSADLIVPPND